MRPAVLIAGAGTALFAAGLLAIATWHGLAPLPDTLAPNAAESARVFLARDGTPLNRPRSGNSNATDFLPLWQIPPLLRDAFVASEDRRFWEHGGVDWRARFAALWTDLEHGRVVRGASTIPEQAARILHPRGHTLWGHWLAGFDAARLLKRFGHAEVLDFYLNEVPYGGERRGVDPAARFYFGRRPGALDPAEQLAIAVLVRSPSRYDPDRHPRALRAAVDQLAGRMLRERFIGADQYAAVLHSGINPGAARLAVDAGPFVVYASRRAARLGLPGARVRTTLDPGLETFVQQILRRRLADLETKGVTNAAALVVDDASGDVLAWAVAPKGNPFGLDPVLVPRQPGSTLKPFVYGLAFERLGWEPDTVIEDTPLAERIGSGVHDFTNYSGRHYGRVSLRYALANSLNIPAVKTAQAVGVPAILATLHALGISTLDRSADFYGPAIVLGDGPVRLFDLVQAYSALARRGAFLPLRVLASAPQPAERAIFSPAVASLLANILSDPGARAAEFGTDSVLDLPSPTAVKTGTSSDYRDAWTLGFDDRYTVGVWMGRLRGGDTDGITGSTGPALVLREIFARLRSSAPYPGLWSSPQLVQVQTCEWIGPPPCIRRTDWRLPTGSSPRPNVSNRPPTFARPLPGETLAIDPRLPQASQRYTFLIDAGRDRIERVRWLVDGTTLATTRGNSEDWQLVPGKHAVSAEVWLRTRTAPVSLGPVHFEVLATGR